jgi:hypothetical protein
MQLNDPMELFTHVIETLIPLTEFPNDSPTLGVIANILKKLSVLKGEE